MKSRFFELAGWTVCMLGAAVCAHGVTVSIPNTNAVVATTVEVPIIIDDAANVAGFQFTVTYDPNVLYIDPNVASNTVVLAGSLDPNWTITANTTVPGEVRLIGVDPTLTGLTSGAGTLAKIIFTVKGEVGQTDHPAFTTCKLKNSNAQDIAATSTAGVITIFHNGGFINVTITPAGVIALGAQWQSDSGAWQNSDIPLNVEFGAHVVKFKDIEGYVTPADLTVNIVTLGETIRQTAHYVAKGDMDDNGTFDITDVILGMRMAIELPITLDGQEYTSPYIDRLKSRMDLDANPSSIGIGDVVFIMNKALGL